MPVLGQVVAPRFLKPCDSTVPEDPAQRRLIRRGVKITDGYPTCFYSSTDHLAMLYNLYKVQASVLLPRSSIQTAL
ncbi:hypothetical protein MKW92_014775 [Papaver armeniacum]|nr:hypothetical protein MKW92_014775 [Papaver armeniacum]